MKTQEEMVRKGVWGCKNELKEAHFLVYIASCPDGLVVVQTRIAELQNRHSALAVRQGYSLFTQNPQGVNFHSLELPSGPRSWYV
jgi:hypothetical protein